jgi:hypothetical protein
VGAPRFAVTSLQRHITRFQKENRCFKIFTRLELHDHPRKITQKLSLADIDTERRPGNPGVLQLEEMDKARDQLYRQVVDAEIAEILKDVHR